MEDEKMKKEIQLQNYRKWIFGVVVFISYISFYVYNVLTPHMSDDLLFDKSVHQTIEDIFRQEYISFMTHSGRCVLQIIMRFFMIFPKGVFDIPVFRKLAPYSLGTTIYQLSLKVLKNKAFFVA